MNTAGGHLIFEGEPSFRRRPESMNTAAGNFVLPCSWVPAFAGMTGYPAGAGQAGMSLGSGRGPAGSNCAK